MKNHRDVGNIYRDVGSIYRTVVIILNLRTRHIVNKINRQAVKSGYCSTSNSYHPTESTFARQQEDPTGKENGQQILEKMFPAILPRRKAN